MNLFTLKSLIEKLADDGFTSTQEKLIALALAILDEEIQQCDIIETLKLGKKHCLDNQSGRWMYRVLSYCRTHIWVVGKVPSS